MDFVEDFLGELEKADLPYLFKFSIPRYGPSNNTIKCVQNDTLVIYADTEERVVQYINILNGILERKPEYKKSIHRPSAHLGIVNDYIGYGKEFVKDTSYSSVFEECSFPFAALNETSIHFGRKINGDELIEMLQKNYSESKKIVAYFKAAFWKIFYENAKKQGYDLNCVLFNKTQNRRKTNGNTNGYSRPNILDEHTDEFFEGTHIYKPRGRSVNESETEYVEFLRKYYEAVYASKKTPSGSSSITRDKTREKKKISLEELLQKAKKLIDKKQLSYVTRQEVSDILFEVRETRINNKNSAYQGVLNRLEKYFVSLINEFDMNNNNNNNNSVIRGSVKK